MTDRDRPTPPDPHRLPTPRPRQQSAPRVVVREEVAPHAVRQPGAQPPPVPKRPRIQTETGMPAPPANAWREEVTGRGVPHPPGAHPPRSQSPPPQELATTEPEVVSAREAGAAKAGLQDEQEARRKAEARARAAEAELSTRRQFDATQQAVKDAQERRELADAPKTLRMQYGGIKVTVPTVVLTALLTAGITTYLEHKAPPAPPPTCVTREEFNSFVAKTNERIQPIETHVDLLLITRK